MSDLYFSERERGEVPRDRETIASHVWEAIEEKKEQLVSDGSFGKSYPEFCHDGGTDPVGTNDSSFNCAMRGEIPGIANYYNAPFASTRNGGVPPTHVIIRKVGFRMSISSE